MASTPWTTSSSIQVVLETILPYHSINCFRDTKLEKYKIEDFELSDEVKIDEFKTILNKEESPTKTELENILITFEETTDIRHHRDSRIRFERMNHIPFTYKIKIQNPKLVSKKVIVRIFLALALDDSDIRQDYSIS